MRALVLATWLAFPMHTFTQSSVVVGWGLNDFGQSSPGPGATDIVGVAADFRYSLAVRASGMVVGWGISAGNPPPDLRGAVSVVCRGGHNLAVRADGTVAAWSPLDPPFAGMLPAGLSNVLAVAESGYPHSMALRSDGTVVAWGRGRTNVPPGLTNVIGIAVAGEASLALRSDGIVVAWDANGVYLTNSVPAGLSNVVAIAASHLEYCMALKSDGTITVWGRSAGGFGRIPAGLSNVVAIAAGGSHSLALQADGTVTAWGDNSFGQLNVPAAASNITAIAAGFENSLAVRRSTPSSWPRLLEMPQSGRVLAGGSWTFHATAMTSAPLSYRWQHRGHDLPNQTNASLALSDLRFDQAGDYAVIVSAGGLAVRSAPGFLALYPPPQAIPQHAIGREDTDLIVTLDGLDPNGLDWQAKVSSLPRAGSLFQFSGNGRGDAIQSVPTAVTDSLHRVLYVPDPDGNGAAYDAFQFQAGDEIGDGLSASVSIQLAAVNDPPRFTSGPDVRVDEDAGPQVIAGWASGIVSGPADEADQQLEFIVQTDRRELFIRLPSLDGTGTLSFTPAPDAFGLATVTVQLHDDGGTADGGSDTSLAHTFTITMVPVNDPPVVFAQASSPGALSGNFTRELMTLAANGSNALVRLDATRSFDVDSASLAFSWRVDGALLPVATNAQASERLPIGRHVLVLSVSDGLAESMAEVSVEVLSPAEGVEQLNGQLSEVPLGGQNKRPLIATLKSAAASFERGDRTAGLNQLTAFQHKIAAQLSRTDRTSAKVLTQAVVQLITMLQAAED